MYLFDNIWNDDQVNEIFNEIMMPIKMLIPYNIFNQSILFIDKFFKQSKESCEFITKYNYKKINYNHFEYFLINHKNIAVNCLNRLVAHNNFNFIHSILYDAINKSNMNIINIFYKDIKNIKNEFERYYINCYPTKIKCIDFALKYFPEKIDTESACSIIISSGYKNAILKKLVKINIFNKMIVIENDYSIQFAKFILINLVSRHYEYGLDKYYKQLEFLNQYVNFNTFFDKETISCVINCDCAEYCEFEEDAGLSLNINNIIEKILSINEIYYDKQNEDDTYNISKADKNKYNLSNRNEVLLAIKDNYKYFNLIPIKLRNQYKNDYEIMYNLYKSNGNGETYIPEKFLSQIYLDYIIEIQKN